MPAHEPHAMPPAKVATTTLPCTATPTDHHSCHGRILSLTLTLGALREPGEATPRWPGLARASRRKGRTPKPTRFPAISPPPSKLPIVPAVLPPPLPRPPPPPAPAAGSLHLVVLVVERIVRLICRASAPPRRSSAESHLPFLAAAPPGPCRRWRRRRWWSAIALLGQSRLCPSFFCPSLRAWATSSRGERPGEAPPERRRGGALGGREGPPRQEQDASGLSPGGRKLHTRDRPPVAERRDRVTLESTMECRIFVIETTSSRFARKLPEGGPVSLGHTAARPAKKKNATMRQR